MCAVRRPGLPPAVPEGFVRPPSPGGGRSTEVEVEGWGWMGEEGEKPCTGPIRAQKAGLSAQGAHLARRRNGDSVTVDENGSEWWNDAGTSSSVSYWIYVPEKRSHCWREPLHFLEEGGGGVGEGGAILCAVALLGFSAVIRNNRVACRSLHTLVRAVWTHFLRNLITRFLYCLIRSSSFYFTPNYARSKRTNESRRRFGATFKHSLNTQNSQRRKPGMGWECVISLRNIVSSWDFLPRFFCCYGNVGCSLSKRWAS